MTNKQALQEVAQIPSLSDAAIEKAFLDSDSGLTDSGTYISANEQAIDEIAIAVLSNFLEASISEGGYSITYNDAIAKKIARLKLKWGIDQDEGKPTITDVSKMW